MISRYRLVVLDPFVHAPNMGVVQFQTEAVDDSCHQGQLFCGPNRAADARRIVGRRLLPRLDVFQCFSTVEFLQCVVEGNFEALTRQALQIASRETSGILKDF